MRKHLWRLRERTIHIERRPLLMGIVNVTPDSFSDGGSFLDPGRAIEHGLRLAAEGADLLDVGGESTRPGSQPVPTTEEWHRIAPVIAGLTQQAAVPVSVDTSKAAVAERALDLGASIVNDVSGLAGDPEMVRVARKWRPGLVLMHMQGTPATMQDNPSYTDVVSEVREYLRIRLAALAEDGIEAECVVLDPGIGFGKRLGHNLDLLRGLAQISDLGRPVCLGVSRKGFINRVLGYPGAAEVGTAGTIGVVLRAVAANTAQVLRVHDVRAVNEALTMFLAVE